jgi:hypothetical protein
LRWNAGLDAERNRGLFRRHTVIQFPPSREALRAVRPTQAHARPVSTAHPAIDARSALFRLRLAEVIELHGCEASEARRRRSYSVRDVIVAIQITAITRSV